MVPFTLITTSRGCPSFCDRAQMAWKNSLEYILLLNLDGLVSRDHPTAALNPLHQFKGHGYILHGTRGGCTPRNRRERQGWCASYELNSCSWFPPTMSASSWSLKQIRKLESTRSWKYIMHYDNEATMGMYMSTRSPQLVRTP